MKKVVILGDCHQENIFNENLNKNLNFDLNIYYRPGLRVVGFTGKLNELKDATNAEDVVDALIDLCVVAIGTLDIFGIDPYKAWDEVLKANMNKTPGVNPSRPNPLNLPDLIKPAGWSAPSHAENHGNLGIIFNV